MKNGIQKKLFSQVIELLHQKDLILKRETIVDSTIIAVPSSTKNKEKKRDPQAHSVKKGNTWRFGYKAHVGVDSKTGLVHTVKVTAENVDDVTVMPDYLLTSEETYVYGYNRYIEIDNLENSVIKNKCRKKIGYKINRRPSQMRRLSKDGQYKAKKIEHQKSSVRTKVEHVFGVVKKFFKYRKTQYRGIKKQTQKMNMMFALANYIWLTKKLSWYN